MEVDEDLEIKGIRSLTTWDNKTRTNRERNKREVRTDKNLHKTMKWNTTTLSKNTKMKIYATTIKSLITHDQENCIIIKNINKSKRHRSGILEKKLSFHKN